MTDVNDTWEKMLHEIEKEMTFLSFSTWFQTSRLLSVDEEAKTVTLEAKEGFIGSVLRDRYQETLEKAAETVLGAGYSVTVVDPQAGTESKRQPIADAGEGALSSLSYGENFGMPDFGKVSAELLIELAPMTVIGPAGSGKTYLLNQIKEKLARSGKVCYDTAEAFTNDFLTALRYNKVREFRNSLDEMDYYIIDNLDEMAGKETIQSELYEKVLSWGKPVFLSAVSLDRLDKRIIAFLTSGILYQIAELSEEDRKTVLRDVMEKYSLQLYPDVVELLENYNFKMPAEITGIVKSLKLYQTMRGDVDVEFCRNLIRQRDVLSGEKQMRGQGDYCAL